MAKKILTVEDDKDLLEMYSSSLSKEGYEVIAAENGQQGFYKASNDCFDLVITDIKMPGIQGHELIRKIRESGKNKDVPFLVISGYIDDFITTFLSDVTQVHYLEKPLASEDIIKKVKELISVDTPKKAVSIDVTVVKPFIVGLVGSLKKNIQVTSKPSKATVKKHNDSSGDFSFLFCIQSASYKGSIAFAFSDRLFQVIAQKVIGRSVSSSGSGMQELGNEFIQPIIEEAFKSLESEGKGLIEKSREFYAEPGHAVVHPSELPVMALPFKTDKGGFQVEICASQ